MATKSKSIVSTDHDEIRRWAEERGAQPACVKGTGKKGDLGMLRLEFPNSRAGKSADKSLQQIGWDEWFQKFDEQNLALLHQEETATGKKSNFNKLVSRETAEAAEGGGRSRRVGARRTPKTGESRPRHPERAAAARKRSRKA
ncbi:MAG TPA: hypothetical protein VKV15_08620 [Bryobacteraceae bacterium]|nr:hypothetical protein [Bryobacteraceae bacterium]